jgi:hypothetical protein
MKIVMSIFRGCSKMKEWQEEMSVVERQNRRKGERDRGVLKDMCLVLKPLTKETTADLVVKIELEHLQHLDAVFVSRTGYDGNGRVLIRGCSGPWM